jgi:hypothetical protein
LKIQGQVLAGIVLEMVMLVSQGSVGSGLKMVKVMMLVKLIPGISYASSTFSNIDEVGTSVEDSNENTIH